MIRQKSDITFKDTKEIKPLLKQMQRMLYKRLTKDSSISTLLLLIIGILNRTYELTDSAIWSIENLRPLTASQMLRALYETLAYIYYWKQRITGISDIQQRENDIKQALLGSRREGDQYQQVNILTCIDKATRQFTELRRNYDDTSETVHPNSASHFYVAKATDEIKQEVEFIIPFYQFKGDDRKALINQVGECCHHIVCICKELIKLS